MSTNTSRTPHRRKSPLEESKEPPITLCTLPVVRISIAFNPLEKQELSVQGSLIRLWQVHTLVSNPHSSDDAQAVSRCYSSSKEAAYQVPSVEPSNGCGMAIREKGSTIIVHRFIDTKFLKTLV